MKIIIDGIDIWRMNYKKREVVYKIVCEEFYSGKISDVITIGDKLVSYIKSMFSNANSINSQVNTLKMLDIIFEKKKGKKVSYGLNPTKVKFIVNKYEEIERLVKSHVHVNYDTLVEIHTAEKRYTSNVEALRKCILEFKRKCVCEVQKDDQLLKSFCDFLLHDKTRN